MSVSLQYLLEPARFEALLLELYGPELMPSQRPVLVSQWSKYYFALIWQSLLGGASLTEFAVTELTLDGRGLPLALSEHGEHCAGLAAILEQHLQPLVLRLAALGPVASAVLWGNAGDCLDQALQRAEGNDCGLGHLLSSPDSPLYAAVSLDESGQRRRRTCCLSYKVQWVGHCEHCPLLA
ncbi:ferric iron reductase involved in ferric hydroximate transport [compost metagenome]|uniref:siderophore-iron reductase FhuF n=1 Tax=unclassified Pseudomonas TaxID=196821 RepID=UPI000697294E|nr:MULTISPECIES: siderophore-iron reductase FhuF [unclassified Pseudomonas]QYX47547.1 siderophore-iron reductase FhuF [Pseudomonas sp. S11A 273]